jgi:hypothetical protein
VNESLVTDHSSEEPWLRDITAANFGVEIRTEADAAALCGDDAIFCEYCGWKFPLWPIREWAAHVVHEHNDALTVQQIGAIAQFCSSHLTPPIRQWFGMQILQRVSIRRRARDLGLIRWAGVQKTDA